MTVVCFPPPPTWPDDLAAREAEFDETFPELAAHKTRPREHLRPESGGGSPFWRKRIGRLGWLIVVLATASVLASTIALGDEISPNGQAIAVENWSCVVVNQRAIECRNIGRVCQAARADDEGPWHQKFFGCAVRHVPCPTEEENKNHWASLEGCMGYQFY